MSLRKRSKILRITLLSSCIYLVAGVLTPIEAKIKKDETIQLPLGDSQSITWGDLNTINWKLNAAFGSMFLWFLTEAYKSYRGTEKKNKESLESIVKTLERFEEKFRNIPSKDEVGKLIKDEIVYSNELRKGK